MTTATEADTLRMVWRGPLSRALKDSTRHLDVEGAIRSGKTTMALWKVLNYCLEHPGIKCLVCRYTEDALAAIVKPVWREICQGAGVAVAWHPDEGCDVLANGSRVYLRGLKSSDETQRYSKFRGLTLAVIYVDQAEELPADFWPELQGRLSQPHYPQQIILTPNPPDHNHWIAAAFPEDNHIHDSKYVRVSTYDNAHNLGPAYIPALEAAYPPGHSKRGPLLLGIRGLNVKGRPVYAGNPEDPDSAGVFNRRLHVGPVAMNPQVPLLEAVDFGQHHPCIIWAQFTPYGGLWVLGGVMGQDMVLEDFAPLAKLRRAEWFPDPLDIWTCCDPAGSHANSQGVRKNGVMVLQDHGFAPRWIENANAPDLRWAAIERISGYMRRRTQQGEAFQVHPDRWLVIGANTVRRENFLVDGLEAGYVWDEHRRTSGGKHIAVPVKDGWYEHGQNCLEYLELNFGGKQPSQKDVLRQAEVRRQATLHAMQRDVDPYDLARRPKSARRGGY